MKVIMQRSVPAEIEGKDAGGALGAAVYNAATIQVRRSQVPVSATHEVTLLLAKRAEGNQQALEELTPLVYRELRHLAASYLRKERQGHTLLERAVSFEQERGHDLVALDASLTALERIDPRKCKAVELRYFGGLAIEEIAQSLEVSAVTVRRDLRMAEAWLNRKMQSG